ncbi:MAG: class I SAM-dependent methyltransferase [Bacteriovoracaceae bacterium]|nr:class I SAM-dependent methyltransferase [Bacteriovoracaceae bacterium]
MKEFSKKYLEIINNKFKGLNLVSVKEFEKFEQLLVQDSIKPLSEVLKFSQSIRSKKYIIDIGFGGGFPLLPLALKNTEKTVIGIDARKKKVIAVGEIAKELKIPNVILIHSRVEDIVIDIEATVTIKAVGDIENILKKINTTKRLNVFFYKGPNIDKKEEYKDILSNWKNITNEKYDLNGTDGRTIVGFQNKNVPCGTFLKKKLVKLSTII